MSIKPFSEAVKANGVKEEMTAPFVDSAKGGQDVEANYFDEVKVTQEANFVVRTIGFFSSLRGVIVLFTLFVLTVLLIDAIATIQELFVSGSILDILYLAVLFLLLSSLTLLSYKNYRQVKMLKSASRFQKQFEAQKESPDKKIVPLALELLSHFSNRSDAAFQKQSDILKERISSSHDYSAIYKELDEDVLAIVDTKAEERIKVASAQAALSTAISPLALLDAAIVIWRGVRLTKEIAALYGLKPGWISTVVLLKRGAFSIFFVGATELAVEYMNAASESTVVSKISLSAGEGISNGVLLARIGYGVMSACRPLPMRVKRGSFLASMVSSIKGTILQSKT